jgi:PleD family two-component response regulator
MLAAKYPARPVLLRPNYEVCYMSSTNKIAAKSLKPRKLLIIDDSVTIAEALKLRLQNVGYEVVLQTKSLGTMVTILREKPDLILLDIEMPMINGGALCTLIKNNPNIPQVPIIFYSSLSDKELSALVTETNAQGYISKSLPIATVIDRIGQWL